MERDDIQNYINNFRRYIGKYLKKDIGIKVVVYQYDKGVILSLEFAFNGANKDEYRSEASNLSEAVQRSSIKSIKGEINNIVFGGTNMIMEENRIFIIKDDQLDEWSDDQAKKDVTKLLTPNTTEAHVR